MNDLLRWLAVALLAGVIYVEGVQTVAWTSGRPPAWGVGLSGLVGGLVGAGMGRWGQRQRYGAGLWSRYRRALASGTLPPDADPAVWSPLLTDRVQMLHRGARIVYPLLAVICAGWLILAVQGRLGALWWLVGGALGVAVLLSVRNHLRLRRRLVDLWRQLPSVDDESPAG